MNLLYVGSDTIAEHNCEEWRCAIPFRAMRRAGVRCEFIHIEQWVSGLEDPYTEKADLVIFQRNVFAEVFEKISYWRGRRKPIVVDLDDAYELMTKDTGVPSYDFWINHKMMIDGKESMLYPTPMNMLHWGVKVAGAVSSPSELILKDWEKYGVKKYFLPNYIESGLYKRYDVYKQPDKIFIGGGGSMGHIKSWADSGVYEALGRVCKEDKRIIVVFTGDERNWKTLDNIPVTQRTTMGWIPYVLYSRGLSLFDIGLVPLSGEYDRRRSWIKTLEYSLMGIPWIGTDYEPNRYVKGGRLVDNTEEGWYQAIKEYIDRLPELQVQSFDAKQSIVDEYDIDKNLGKLLEVYEKAIKEANRE